MPAPRNRKHVFVNTAPAVDSYTPHPKLIKVRPVPAPPDRTGHGNALKTALQEAEGEIQARREASEQQVHGARPGIYVEFESLPNIELNLTSLENRRAGIELVAVQEQQTQDDPPVIVHKATVFVPEGKTKYFVSRFEKYARETPKQAREQRHEDMVDRIAALRLATLRALWTDATEVYPANDEVIWWEVWLRRQDGNELQRLFEFGDLEGLEFSQRRLLFDDRIITLVRGSADQLSHSLEILGDLAEVRKAKETAGWFVDLTPVEQAEWADELAERSNWAQEDAYRVCVLDTGINRGHPLVEPSLSAEDMHACEPAWGTDDNGGGPTREGHGTNMAGLALFGDLTPVLASTDPVTLRHRLESVKILPPIGDNDPQMYGTLMAIAASRVEIQAPNAKRCFSMAITATDERDRGEPTSWSAAIDALAAGRTFDTATQGLVYLEPTTDENHRLFLVSAGNVLPENLQINYLDRCDIEAVHDPGQAWNALTVGGFTDKVMIQDPAFDGQTPLGRGGDLSPWTTTSVPFGQAWPLKPEVVFEAGNVARTSEGEIDFGHADLNLLTTYYRPTDRLFDLCNATSAATAQVARLAGLIGSEYPDMWPETVRGLIVHSAQWTPAMQQHLQGAGGKKARGRLVRRYGYGIPNASRALRSASDALTLIVQGTIHPFADGKMHEMNSYNLPWPKEALEGLGATPARLRVTLSYFIEPNPGRRGWRRRHRYASHGLRFDVKTATESPEEFRKRLNQQALAEEEEKPPADGTASNWYLGEQTRNRGSIHSDLWVGTGADLAERYVVGIYPVTGWWKEQPKRDRSEVGVRYSLILSIETDAENVDIWTPVAVQIGVPVEIVIEI